MSPCLTLPSAPCTLFDALASVPDRRGLQGIRHPLPAVMGMVALAILISRKSLTAIARFGRQYGPALAHALGFKRGKAPSTSTLSRTLRRIDPEDLEAVLTHWVRGGIDPTTLDHIAIARKALRGSRHGEVPGYHLVAAYAPTVKAVLAEIRGDAKTNERWGISGRESSKGSRLRGNELSTESTRSKSSAGSPAYHRHWPTPKLCWPISEITGGLRTSCTLSGT